jgi:hypothetical protein
MTYGKHPRYYRTITTRKQIVVLQLGVAVRRLNYIKCYPLETMELCVIQKREAT